MRSFFRAESTLVASSNNTRIFKYSNFFECTSTEPASTFKGHNPCLLSTGDHGAADQESFLFWIEETCLNVQSFLDSNTGKNTTTSTNTNALIDDCLPPSCEPNLSRPHSPHERSPSYDKTSLHVTDLTTITSTCSTNAPPKKHVERPCSNQLPQCNEIAP